LPNGFQAKVVMMPCVLRRQNMNGDLAWFQVIGFVVRSSANADQYAEDETNNPFPLPYLILTPQKKSPK
jgi:hypothetical protein